MAVQVGITKDALGFYSYYSGDVSTEDLLEAIDYKLDKFNIINKLHYNITDYSQVKGFDYSTDAIINAAYNVSDRLDELRNGFLTVAIVNSEIQYGMMRLWGNINNNKNLISRIVYSKAEANKLIHEHLAKVEPRQLYHLRQEVALN